MVSDVLPPSYLLLTPFLYTNNVGNPCTSYFCAKSFSTVASTFPNLIPFDFNSVAAKPNSGANFLQ